MEQPDSSKAAPVTSSDEKMPDWQTLEMLRLMLLQQANRYAPNGASIEAFLMMIKATGFTCTVRDVEREMQYLMDKGYIVEVSKPLGPENHSYRIHAHGRDYLALRNIKDEA